MELKQMSNKLFIITVITAIFSESVSITFAVSSADKELEFMKWKHFTITPSLPGSSWGTGGIGVADFNGDGNPDVAVSRRETKTAYWFERKDDATWVRHTIATSEHLERTLGTATLDMDQDGWIDVVFWGVWFKNPGKTALQDTPWKAFSYDGGGHDIITADISGDDSLDLISYDGHVLCWFDPARNLSRSVILEGRNDHGGIAPRGVGDLNGDGHPDIVIPGLWLENPGQGRGTWRSFSWPHKPVKNASYGTSMRVWVADINSDGVNDIVYSDCDTGFSHVYWVENHQAGKKWSRHQLPDPPGDSRTGSFHSLGIADLNQDGSLEIFAGEQEDPDTYMMSNGLLPMKPPGLKERGVIWVRIKGTEPVFKPIVIHEDNPGWHDAVLFDMDGDGDMDIINKVWNADSPAYHLDFWRNDIKSN
jgi:hypothetical protein